MYLKQGDKFVLQQVRLGETRGNDVEVLAGLQAGDVMPLTLIRCYSPILYSSKREPRL
ncbi:MAG: hypothetical protein LRY40_05745 [Shewanella fodinae]|nr:hypothetical protein [Shewanella fodinae]